MKITNKKLVGFISLITCLSILFSCGGDPGKLPDQSFSGSLEEGEHYTIEFYGWGDAAEQANYQTLINQFNELHDNITVYYTGDSATTYMTTLRSKADNLPDVFYMPDTEFLQWADAGRLLNIKDAVSAEKMGNVWSEATDKYYYNRNTYELGYSESAGLYGLPKDLGPFTLVYNVDLLNEVAKLNNVSQADVDKITGSDPISWEEFVRILKLLDNNPNDELYGISHFELESAIYSNNANFFTEDTSTQKITDKNFSDAVQFVADLHLVHGVMPSPDDQVSTNGFQRFQNKGCIFSFMGPWDNSTFWESVDFSYDVVPVPYGNATGAESVTWLGSMAYSISAKTKSPAASLLLAEYLSMDSDAQEMFYKLGQQVPNDIKMAKNEYLLDTENVFTGAKSSPASREVFVDIIDGKVDANDKVSGKARSSYYTYDTTWYIDFLDQLEPVWRGDKTASKVMADYAETFDYLLKDMISQYR